MEGFRVLGGERIEGSIRVDAAKNAVLPILAAAILPEGDVIIRDCPDIRDVHAMAEILGKLGCETIWQNGEMLIRNGRLHQWEMPDELSKQIRSSIFLLGPILGKLRRATVTYPGGCEIGIRPIDLHLKGLRALGVRIVDAGGVLYCDGRDMHAGDVYFDYPSVGATENVMMAAVLLPGITTIHNAAKEPEIEDLQRFINRMGGKIRGAGTQIIEIEGVEKLHGISYSPIPDRIVAGTLLCAGAMNGGKMELSNVHPWDLVPVIDKLQEMGCRIRESGNRLTLEAPERLHAISQLQTQPHPGFPTDMQAQMLAACCVARGTSVIIENVFENRLSHVADLCRMGANIRVNGRMAVVQGVDAMHGMRVTARDLRGGAALVLAGLCAQGETIVENIALIDRGYAHLEDTLSALGAKIDRIDV
ncbi:MAG: UDP-N-acetylglucosamine 1-carboxyvinyltransferase [Clostridia bacterium]|nr:UDP-N-acetylglucosamine 1-carboxyvinyltransferase [Clostridia bacterium]MBQ6805325.1 UDP-N-acetylglucosamine 1-carboxyvinyltransferase [Clostridia bacterium]